MNSDMVRLCIPAKAEYLLTARLVVGAIFGQAGFDVDDIEDAKTAMSEACLLLMPEKGAKADLELALWVDKGVHTEVSTDGEIAYSVGAQEREFSRFMLEALIDQVEYLQKENRHIYRLFKALPA